jgi:transcriptional regulator with XRE-family HTH domain
VKTNATASAILASNLMRLRSRAAMTQEQVAEASDLHWRYLQTLESGKSNPSLKVLCRLKKGLACSWDELLGKGG